MHPKRRITASELNQIANIATNAAVQQLFHAAAQASGVVNRSNGKISFFEFVEIVDGSSSIVPWIRALDWLTVGSPQLQPQQPKSAPPTDSVDLKQEASDADPEAEGEGEGEEEEGAVALVLTTSEGQELAITADDLVALRRIRSQIGTVPLQLLVTLFSAEAKKLAVAEARGEQHPISVLTRSGFRAVLEHLIPALKTERNQVLAQQLDVCRVLCLVFP